MSLIVVSSERFAEHRRRPAIPESPERAEVMDVVADEWRGGTERWSRRARRRASNSHAFTTGLPEADRRDSRDRDGARSRHLHVARDLRNRADSPPARPSTRSSA